MRDFTIEDLSGAGQYLIRNDKPRGMYTDAGFMSTIMKKVGYTQGRRPDYLQCYALVCMSDGLIQEGYFITKDSEGNKLENTKDWTYVAFDGNTSHEGKQKLVDYLNDDKLCTQEYRFASQEEVVRVVMYQKSRWR